MSSVEEQLRRDIAAVTNGVVVSDSDLRDARASLEERIEINEQRGRNRTLLAAAAAAVVVAAVGFTAFQALSEDDSIVTPAGEGESTDLFADFLKGAAPTPQNLDGYWRVDGGGTMVLFSEDGTVQFSDSGRIISRPDSVGTYEIDGDEITVTVTGNSPVVDCGGPVNGGWRSSQLPRIISMRAALPEPGYVNIVLPDAQLGTCEQLATTIGLERIVPTAALAGLDNSDLRGWQPVTDRRLLLGDWLAEGGGFLLEMVADGSYYVVDDSTDVVDNGYWRFRDSALELFSRTESPQCQEGDWLRIGDLQRALAGTTVLRGAVEQNDCGGGWTPVRWIRIPDHSPSDTSGT